MNMQKSSDSVIWTFLLKMPFRFSGGQYDACYGLTSYMIQRAQIIVGLIEIVEMFFLSNFCHLFNDVFLKFYLKVYYIYATLSLDPFVTPLFFTVREHFQITKQLNPLRALHVLAPICLPTHINLATPLLPPNTAKVSTKRISQWATFLTILRGHEEAIGGHGPESKWEKITHR